LDWTVERTEKLETLDPVVLPVTSLEKMGFLEWMEMLECPEFLVFPALLDKREKSVNPALMEKQESLGIRDLTGTLVSQATREILE